MTGNLNIFELAQLRFPVFTQVDEMYQILTEPSEKFRRDVEVEKNYSEIYVLYI